jgi:conjugal transfer mating pair stabilization protein TraN
LCDDNGKCPVKSGETIVSSCSFSSGNQGQVLSTLASLGEIKDDLKCNGKEPSEANCNLGNITIFNGESHHCSRNPIVGDLSNCCKNDKEWIFLHCDSSGERAIAEGREQRLCKQIGEYCSSRVPIIGTCKQRRQGWCCFKSKLARIIQQQGRPQIKAYYYNNPSRGDPSSMDWGDARNPNCRGFTSVEFQVLDFSKIDLSEFFGDMNIDPQRINDQLDELDKHQDNAGWRDNMQDKVDNDDYQTERMEDAEEVREGR